MAAGEINVVFRFSKRFFRSFSTNEFKLGNMTMYSGEEKSKTEIRNHLAQFAGGSVNLIKRNDGLAIVTLSQSRKRNAMTGKMMRDLEEVVTDLHTWTEGKGIILKGAGNNFCSGGDLDFVKQISSPEQGFMMSTFMQSVLNEFEKLPMISVALVEGSGALGGGAELSVACDFRLITETCRGIGFVHGKMGILPAWGGTNRLVKKLGYTKALDLLSRGDVRGPEECLNLGLVDRIIPESVENAEDFAVNWLKKRLGFDACLTRAIKMSASAARDEPGCYEIERRIFAPFWGSEKNKEALRKNLKHHPADTIQNEQKQQ